MPIEIWSPVAFLVMMAAFYFLKRHAFYDLYNSQTSSRLFGNYGVASLDAAIPLPDVVEKSGSLSKQDTLEGARELAAHARGFSPDWIIGVEPGGRFLSVIVSDLMNFPKGQCLSLQKTDGGSSLEFVPQTSQSTRGGNVPFEGRLLVIDDISRSGLTLCAVRSFLLAINFRMELAVDRVQFATLLDCVADRREPIRPDWAWRTTKSVNLRFPWSGFSEDVRYARSRLYSPEFAVQDDAKVRETIEIANQIAADYDSALDKARDFLR